MQETPTLLYDLFRAYYDARKNKRNTNDQLKFELNLEQNLIALYDDLKNHRYEISECIYFINTYPIKREIFAGNFRDRVVHHLIYNYVYDIFDKHFIYDSYSCRVGKGTSLGIKRVDKFIRSCSQNYTKDCYILKLDISGYFMSINKDILFKKIEKVLKDNFCHPEFISGSIMQKKYTKQCIKDPETSSGGQFVNIGGQKYDFDYKFLMNLIKIIIYNDCTKNSIFKGKREDYIGLPKNKSLFFAKTGYGLPIGNLTSQLFSNIYLSDFDKYIKRESSPDSTGSGLFYGRYVDDFIIVHHDKNFLISMIEKTRNYLNDNLGLTLHPNKIYLQHYSKGVLFLGCYIKPYRLYIRKRTLGNFYKTICNINKKFQNHDIITKNDFHKYILSPINSYLGFIKNTSSFKVKIKIIKKLDKGLLNFLYLDYKFNKIILKYDNLPKTI